MRAVVSPFVGCTLSRSWYVSRTDRHGLVDSGVFRRGSFGFWCCILDLSVASGIVRRIDGTMGNTDLIPQH